jgi:hypothetical protein
MGVGVGVGVGVEVDVDVEVEVCACANGAAITTARTKAMPAACISLRAAPLFHISVGHEEQRIKPNPAKPRQLDKKYKIPIRGGDLPPVLREGQPVMAWDKR